MPGGRVGLGKSIIAQTIMGLLPASLPATAGEVLLDGENVLSAGEARLRQLRCTRMSMIFRSR